MPIGGVTTPATIGAARQGTPIFGKNPALNVAAAVASGGMTPVALPVAPTTFKSNAVATSTPAVTATNNNIKTIETANNNAVAQKASTEAAAVASAQKIQADAKAVTIATPAPVAEKSPMQLEAEAGIKTTQSRLEQLYIASDARSAMMIQQIKSEYDQIVAEQEVQNKNYEAAVSTEGGIAGRDRYAPSVHLSIVQGAINSGLSAISKIRVKQNGLIIQAEQARDAQQFQQLNNIMSDYRRTVKEERDQTQQMFQNTIAASQEGRASAAESRAALASKLTNSAGAVARTLQGLSPDEQDAYITKTAAALGVTPLELENAVRTKNEDRDKAVTNTALSLASKFPDAGINNTDLINGDISTILSKVGSSDSYKNATAREKSETDKALYQAISEKNKSEGTTSELLLPYAQHKAQNGKDSSSIPLVIRNNPAAMAQIDLLAKEEAKKLPAGTIVSKMTGFQANNISNAVQLKAASAVSMFTSLKRMEEIIENASFVMGPTGRVLSKGGQLANITSNERVEFEALRDGLNYELVQSISGQAVNEKEFERIAKIVPNSSEWKNYSLVKARTLTDRLKITTSTSLALEGNEIKGIDLTPSWQVVKDSKLGDQFDKKEGDFKGPVSVEIPTTSRLAYVNNNPGNLRYASQEGATTGEKGFAKFKSPEAGLVALTNQVKLDQSRGHTISSFVSKYAPPSENDTKTYIRQATEYLGLPADTAINKIPVDTLARFISLKESSTKIT